MKNPCVAVIQYRPMEDVPPVMSLLKALKDIGRDFHYIGSYSVATERFCKENEIPCTLIPWPSWIYKTPQAMNHPLAKFVRALTFIPKRIFVLVKLIQLKHKFGDVVVWAQAVSGVGIIGNVGMKLFPRRIITRFELYDTYGANWVGFDISCAFATSVMVECEANRARIAQEYFGLKECPLVIPNKPVHHPRTRDLPVNDEVKAVLEKVGDRPLFLYQGIWGKSRMDVAVILETIAKHRPQYCVLSMPGTPEVKAILEKYPNAFTVSRINAPAHLAVTSHASIGVAVYKLPPAGFDQKPYNLDVLNEAYCAPNKIFEYAGFGVPTLGNKVPGLIDSVEKADAGLCVDIEESAILAAADRLVENLAEYRCNAMRFYEETDIADCVKKVLSKEEECHG